MVLETYCPFCKEDYNTISKDTIKCMNCYREYPLEDWKDKVEEARREECSYISQ